MIGTLTTFAVSHGAGFGLHQQLLVGSTVIVVLVIIGMAVVGRQQLDVIPTGLAAAWEHVFDWIDQMAADMIGNGSRQYVPLLMSFFVFILMSNWSGLIPFPVLSHKAQPVEQVTLDVSERLDSSGVVVVAEEEMKKGEEKGEHVSFEAPTASYNTTLALAMISFIAFNWYGLQKCAMPGLSAKYRKQESEVEGHHQAKGGVGGIFTWILHYFQPTPMLWRSMEGGLKYTLVPLLGLLFIGLNIMEELARVVSLSLRLFGNISGEHQAKSTMLSVMYNFMGMSLQGFSAGNFIAGPAWFCVSLVLWGAALFATLLGALAGFIQAMVFMMLSLVYIAHAVADEH